LLPERPRAEASAGRRDRNRRPAMSGRARTTQGGPQ